MYYDTKLKENIGNLQKTWEIFRTLLMQNKDLSVNIPKQITVNKTKINDPGKILSQLNKYFRTIGEKLAGKFSGIVWKNEQYVRGIVWKNEQQQKQQQQQNQELWSSSSWKGLLHAGELVPIAREKEQSLV